MLYAFFLSWAGWFQLGVRLLFALRTGGVRSFASRLLLLVLAWPLLGLLNAVHWVGFGVDEVLFGGYRRVIVDRPVFLLGVPRSGTTFLHRVLADEPAFTTLTMLECILAPSVSERYLWDWLIRVSGPAFSWFGRGFAVLAGPLGSRMDAIHEIRLTQPEEDFLLLLITQHCFLAVVACPESSHYWNLARFDARFSRGQRRRVMDFYYRCVQKHLFYHGEEHRFLSKNPSFTPMLESLGERFRNPCFVACTRSPLSTVPSQLSSLMPAFELLDGGAMPRNFRDRMIRVLHHYYKILAARPTLCVVEMSRLNLALQEVVEEVLSVASIVPGEGFAERIQRHRTASQGYRSAHRYTPESFGLDADGITRQFADFMTEPVVQANGADL